MGSGVSALASIEETVINARDEIVREHNNKNDDQASFLAMIACEQAASVEETLHLLALTKKSHATAENIANALVEIAAVLGRNRPEYVHASNTIITLLLVERDLVGLRPKIESLSKVYSASVDPAATYAADYAVALMNEHVFYSYSKDVIRQKKTCQLLTQLLSDERRADPSWTGYFTNNRILYRLENLLQMYQEHNQANKVSVFLVLKKLLDSCSKEGENESKHDDQNQSLTTATNHTASSPATLRYGTREGSLSSDATATDSQHGRGSWDGSDWVSEDGSRWEYVHATGEWRPKQEQQQQQQHQQQQPIQQVSNNNSFQPTNMSEGLNVLFETLPFCGSNDPAIDQMVFDALRSCIATNARDMIVGCDDEGNTLLHAACKARKAEVARRLLYQLAGIPNGNDLIKQLLRKPNLEGWTPLHISCYKAYSCYAVADVLLSNEKGQYLTKLRDHNGCSPLHYAAASMDSGLVALLMLYGASPNQADMLGFIPVDYCDPDDVACINLLCAGHQDVEVLVDKAKHELASGGADQLASLQRKLQITEEECSELQENLSEMLSGLTITEDQLKGMRDELEKERKLRMQSQADLQDTQGQLNDTKVLIESTQEELHREQVDRMKLSKELEKVLRDIEALSAMHSNAEEGSLEQAAKVAELYDLKETLQGQLRGCNAELKRLNQLLEDALASGKMSIEQTAQVERELMAEQGLREQAEAHARALESELAARDDRLQAQSFELEEERNKLREQQQLSAEQEAALMAKVTIERARMEDERRKRQKQEALLRKAMEEKTALRNAVEVKQTEGHKLETELESVRETLALMSSQSEKKRKQNETERLELEAREAGLVRSVRQAADSETKLKVKLSKMGEKVLELNAKMQEAQARLEEQLKISQADKEQLDKMRALMAEADKRAEQLQSDIQREQAQTASKQQELQGVQTKLVDLKTKRDKERSLSMEEKEKVAEKLNELKQQESDLQKTLMEMQVTHQDLLERLHKAEEDKNNYSDELKNLRDSLEQAQAKELEASMRADALTEQLSTTEDEKRLLAMRMDLARKNNLQQIVRTTEEKQELAEELLREREARETAVGQLESINRNLSAAEQAAERDRLQADEAKKRVAMLAASSNSQRKRADEEINELRAQLERERAERIGDAQSIAREAALKEAQNAQALSRRLRQEQLLREKAMEDLADARKELNNERNTRGKDLSEELNALKEKLRQEAEERENEKRELENVKSHIAELQHESKESEGKEELALALEEQEAQLQKRLAEMAKHMANMEKEKDDLFSEFAQEQALRKQYYNEIEDLKGKIRVFCRVRPLSTSEIERGCKDVVLVQDPMRVSLQDADTGVRKGTLLEFDFDACFGPQATQEQVFGDAKRLIQTAVDGYNVCIFAYGQTGSGKTYTLTGPDQHTVVDGNTGAMIDSKEEEEENDPHAGITTRSIEELFKLMGKDSSRFEFEASVYVIELYKNKMIDLLWESNETVKTPPVLAVHLDGQGVVYVDNITTVRVDSFEQANEVLDAAARKRKVTSTKMNASSSRSHLVQSLQIKATAKSTGVVTHGKLTVVDLAGSERASKTGATGDTLKEAQAINKSLLALGDVIQALTTGSKHVPYRNHSLTQLMADSIGGNAKTLMFVNVSPADYNVAESKESLRWATRVKNVTNTTHKSVESEQVRKLKEQLQKLKASKSAISAFGK